jgi:hypothetical protein
MWLELLRLQVQPGLEAQEVRLDLAPLFRPLVRPGRPDLAGRRYPALLEGQQLPALPERLGDRPGLAHPVWILRS